MVVSAHLMQGTDLTPYPIGMTAEAPRERRDGTSRPGRP
jgi:hypothetical protein